MRVILHIFLHFLTPFIVSVGVSRERWPVCFWPMAWTILIDLDHLFANPVFKANRCSIDFHVLHSWELVALSFFLIFFKKTRFIGAGLSIHYSLDAIDGLLMLIF